MLYKLNFVYMYINTDFKISSEENFGPKINFFASFDLRKCETFRSDPKILILKLLISYYCYLFY